MGVNNFLRCAFIELQVAGYLDHTALPYPMKPLQVGEDVCMVYEIPQENMQEVLNKVHPHQGRKNAEDLMFDIFNGKTFRWKEAMVLWHKNTNLLVSPYFVESGTCFYDIKKWHPGIEKNGFPRIVK